MDEYKIRGAIDVLDREVPRDGARVKLSQYGGGPDEGQIIANRTGYLRLGIELLKAAIPPSTIDGSAIRVDLEYLITTDSTINFDWFELREIVESRGAPSNLLSAFIGITMIVVTVAFFIFAIIGIVSAVSWFTG